MHAPRKQELQVIVPKPEFGNQPKKLCVLIGSTSVFSDFQL